MAPNEIDFESEITDEAALHALKAIGIPPCPSVVLALQGEAAKADADFRHLARLIGGDVGLAAAVLKLANAPFFGLSGKVLSIQQALTVLGLRNLLKIVYTITLQQGLGQGGKVRMERFWDRSAYKPIAVVTLARRLSQVSADDAYVFGLFHDMGIAALLQQLDGYRETLSRANASSQPFTRIEDDKHRVNHAMAGARLAREWMLPNDVCWAIFYHHNFKLFDQPTEYATPQVRDLIAIATMTEYLVASFLGRPVEAEWRDRGCLALAHFGLTAEDLERLAEEATPALEEARAYRSA